MKSAGAKIFGEMANKYYNVIAGVVGRDGCRRVNIVFVQYLKQSIKEGEGQKRGESSALEVKIYSQATLVPNQWQKYIANPRNKTGLYEFLSSLGAKLQRKVSVNRSSFFLREALRMVQR